MTLVAAVEAVALVATVLLCLRHIASVEGAWTVERRELLNRITHPQIMPVETPPQFLVPDEEPDEIELVGVVQEADEKELAALSPWD